MLCYRRVVLAILVIGLSTITSTPSAVPASDDGASGEKKEKEQQGSGQVNHVEAQIDWIRSKGGFFHEELEFQKLFPDDPESPQGVFTKTNFKEGDTIMTLPQKCLLTSGGTGDECDTVINIAHERALGDKSEYAPYINYLFDGRSMSTLPSQFSDEAKDIMDEIVGVELPTAGTMTGMSYYRFCGDYPESRDEDDEIELDPDLIEESYYFHLRRNWHDKMLPGYDMLNHRNGNYRNVASTATQDGVHDIKVYATRDIEAGEQLLYSYMNSTDSEYSLTFVTQHILRDYGFIEQYPQRWMFRPTRSDLVFELDEKKKKGGSGKEEEGEEPELEVTFLAREAEADEEDPPWGLPDTWDARQREIVIMYLRGHRDRLTNLKKYVYDGVEKLESDHERDTIVQFYEQLLNALQHGLHAIEDIMDEIDFGIDMEKCSVDAEKDKDKASSEMSCMLSSFSDYDDLEGPDPEFRQILGMFCQDEWEYGKPESYRTLEELESHYQKHSYDRLYSRDGKPQDTCLRLHGRLHQCDSNRPQYHEMFIHYPARFLDKPPKRALYMGGGDNMVLHEILKYPSLELVVGLELDQSIVRSSFKHFKTQPHWDNDKVQWWFGDAAKSFLMLPEDYYASFDLIIVDLESRVIDVVMVTEDLNIMDAALLLLAPDGVISRNVDFSFDASHHFTKYSMDLSNVDIPLYCYHGIKMGSNSIDLLTQPHKDHNIDLLYLKPVDEIENRYEKWYNYGNNVTDILRVDSCCKELLAKAKIGNAGVMMILEAEDASMPLISKPSLQESSICRAIAEAGLTKVSVKMSFLEGGKEVMVFLLKEGYVVARSWSELRYVAFDIQLWTKFEELDMIRSKLIKAVGGNIVGKSSSSFRIVTAGMHGLSPDKEGSSTATCPCGPEVKENEAPAEQCKLQDTTVQQSASDIVLAESISIIQDKNASVVILCGQQETKSCSGVQDLMRNNKGTQAQKILPLWTCPNIDGDDESLQKHRAACETDTLRRLEEFVEENYKIGGVVITPEVPRSMGQILNKIFSLKRVERELMTESYIFLETSLVVGPESLWRSALLDRLRTDLDKYDPVHRAEIFFNETSGSNILELGVFSAGDYLFFSHLTDAIKAIESKTDYITEVRTIRNGRNAYIADFAPSMIYTNEDYDHSDADEQWATQKPLGHQTIAQFLIHEDNIKDLNTKKFPVDLMKFLENTLISFEDDAMASPDMKEYIIGEGCVIYALWSTGNAMVSWDGKDRLDLNLFTYEEDKDMHDIFSDKIQDELHGFNQTLDVVAYDEQPRGIGRVVNFKEDIIKEYTKDLDYNLDDDAMDGDPYFDDDDDDLADGDDEEEEWGHPDDDEDDEDKDGVEF